MLNHPIISVVIGIILGLLSGLGVGGGSLLILWLTLILQFPAETARVLNLLFFLAAAGTVTLLRWKKGTICIKAIMPAIVSGCISVILACILGRWIPGYWLRKLFGILLLVIGIRELLYRPK